MRRYSLKRKGKGKERRSSSPSISPSEESSSPSLPDRSQPSKIPRLSSPARVKAVTFSKIATTAAKLNPSKGMAGFASMVNSANLLAARRETKLGLGGTSSGRTRGSTKTSKVAKSDDGFLIGTIVFLVVGVEENMGTSNSSSTFSPMYRLREDVDISPCGLSGMKQSGLCVIKDTGIKFFLSDDFVAVEGKLRSLFPRLFTYLADAEDDITEFSSWLICMRPSYSRKNLDVYSDDQALPKGSDIISVCQLSKAKSGMQHRILYLVTRDPVPSSVLAEWRPRLPASMVTAPLEKIRSGPDSDNDIGGTSDSSGAFKYPSSQKHNFRSRVRSEAAALSEDETNEIEEVINISESSDENISVPRAKAVTPPYLEPIKDAFSSSINFDDIDNPWNS